MFKYMREKKSRVLARDGLSDKFNMDKIINSYSVSKSVKGIWVCNKGEILEIYKNKRKIAEINITKLKNILNQVGIKIK